MFSQLAQTTTRIRTKVGGGVQDGKRKNIGRFDRDLPVGGAIATNNTKTNGQLHRNYLKDFHKNWTTPYTEHHHHQDKSTNHFPLFFDIAITIGSESYNGAALCFTRAHLAGPTNYLKIPQTTTPTMY